MSTQGKTRKRLPTRPTAKSNGMILSFFKITCKSVGLWHCCLMVCSIITVKQHKPKSCHKGKKDISVCLLFSSIPDFSLSLKGHTCSYNAMSGCKASPGTFLSDDRWHQAFPRLFFQEQRLLIIPHAHSA